MTTEIFRFILNALGRPFGERSREIILEDTKTYMDKMVVFSSNNIMEADNQYID